LSLFGYHVDAVIANRLLPAAITDPWFASWKATQRRHLESIQEAFSPLPVLEAGLAGDEVVGVERLAQLATEIYGSTDPAARLSQVEPFRVESAGDALVLSMQVPFVDRSDIELGRSNGELLVAVGSHRRAVVLPASLARREVSGARMTDGRLEVEFVEVTSDEA
jgi:arsenite-transporting ATPase